MLFVRSEQQHRGWMKVTLDQARYLCAQNESRQLEACATSCWNGGSFLAEHDQIFYTVTEPNASATVTILYSL
jgi:hypothetical protein